MGKTKISWATHTWNPVSGCSKISPGCSHCYAERMMRRFKGRNGVDLDRYFAPTFYPGRLAEVPSGADKVVFVGSMSDLFHPHFVEGNARVAKKAGEQWKIGFGLRQYEAIDRVFKAIYRPDHRNAPTFLILTKRPDLASRYLHRIKTRDVLKPNIKWPESFPNVWIGTSVEDKKTAEERIGWLLNLGTENIFLSMEPLIESVDLFNTPFADKYSAGWRSRFKWVILGGESGPGARWLPISAARLIRDQCKSAQVPFFFKQWSEWIPGDQLGEENAGDQCFEAKILSDESYYRIGKARAGAMLDGKIYQETPEWGQ